MLNLKEKAKGRKTKSKIKSDKNVKVKNQTSTIMKKGKGESSKESGRIEQKRKQQTPTTKTGFQATEPMTSRRLKQSSDKSKGNKPIVPSITEKSVAASRTGRATRVKEPVKGNIGEIKTKNKSNKIEEKRQQRKSLLKNIGEFKTSGPTKIQEERKKRVRQTTFPVKDKSIKTSSKISEIEKEKFRKPVPGNRPGVVKTSGPSIVDKSKESDRPTSRLDKIKTRAKMVMDNIARSADNLYPSKQAKDIVIRKSVGGRLDDLGYEEVDKRPTSKNNRSYRGYGAARKN